MKKLIAIACSFMICTLLHADAPTKESVEKLLTVMQVEKLLSSMQVQMDAAMKAGMEQAFKGKNLSPEDQQKVDAVRAKIAAGMVEELSWANLKDLYIQVYTETFTQEEIDGLTAFYETPTGQSFIAKMPVVMQKSMTLMQQRMEPIMQKMQQSIQESVQEIEAEKK